MTLMTLNNDPLFRGIVFAPEDETGAETPETGEQVEQSADAGDGLLSGDEGDTSEAGNDDDTGLLSGDDDDSESAEDAEASEDDANEPFALDREALTSALPEGFEVTDEQAFNGFLDTIEATEDRQELAGNLLTMLADYQASLMQEQADQWNSLQKEWKEGARNHAEYGGENLGQSLATAKQIATEYGGDEFMELLKITGAENHSAMIGFLNKVAAALPGEPKPLNGEPGRPSRPPLADRMFNNV